ncbi:hypothetical protein CANINC_001093 [Pichia inconspicua]|uniref:HMG box domain-containing protein n=1 Tax=Pichia inconspicua TaxID=52247 RepID=A0A4T0X4E6_9ASCO|nr:hypothetical protein CANINC_001093 [[Candida] inconspicua]
MSHDPSSAELKLAKDNLVASLYDLSKAAQGVTKNAYNFLSLLEGEPLDSNTFLKRELAHAAASVNPLNFTKSGRPKPLKDPNAPKKPLTSYILFFNHLRSTVAQANPGLTQTDIAKEVSRQWKEISEEDKSYWKGLYEKEREKYEQEIKLYNESKEALQHAHDVQQMAEMVNMVDMEGLEGIELPPKKKSKKSKK